jgi:hypothetical protein
MSISLATALVEHHLEARVVGLRREAGLYSVMSSRHLHKAVLGRGVRTATGQKRAEEV